MRCCCAPAGYPQEARRPMRAARTDPHPIGPGGIDRPAGGALGDFVRVHPRLFVLSGAGVSTDSGIPGYRDAQGRWLRAPPVLLQEFLRSETVRRRYWARSIAGWPLVAGAPPPPAPHPPCPPRAA